jgi:HEAT repeat protein
MFLDLRVAGMKGLYLTVPNERRAQNRIRQHIAALVHPDSKIAKRAESILIRYYGARALEPLIAACAHPDPRMRYRAAYTLGRTQDPRAFETILALARDPVGEVRYDAAVSLGHLGDPRAVAPLVALMSEPDEEYCVSSAAAMALSYLGSAAVLAVIDALQHGSAEAKTLAPDVLGGIGDPTAIPALRELLSDPDENTRIRGIEALALMERQECLELIVPCLGDPSERVRKNVRFWIDEAAKSALPAR